ncbi:MAG: cyanophycinase [Gemmatimonadetes bacterium]|nr:cyanophycinase [Gemmatimonadota bacterium]
MLNRISMGRSFHCGSALLTLLLLISCGGAEAPADGGGDPGSEDPSRGRLVIIGGGLQAENTAVYQAILDGRSGDGPICVFPTASAEPQESMESAVSRIGAVGGAGSALGVFLTVDNPEDALLPETVETIESCSGFYFSGGQQRRIVSVFRPGEGDAPAYDALVRRFEAGAVVSGSSAGAAIMSDPMIGGGGSVDALHYGIRWEEDAEGVLLEKGLGFLENPLVDQHSLARGRWARLLTAVLGTEAYTFGTGIDENTALVVEGDSAWVVGDAGVAFFDTRDAVRAEEGVGASGIIVSLLGPGDRLDLSTGRVRFNGEKPRVDRTGGLPEGLGDSSELGLFGRWELLQFFAATALLPDTVFTLAREGFEFHFEKGPDFEARAWEGLGPSRTSRGLSAGPYILRYSEVGRAAEGGSFP